MVIDRKFENLGGKMKKVFVILVILFLVVSAGFAEKYELKEEKSFQKVLKFAGSQKPGFVKVENIFGSISVVGYKGSDVKMNVLEIISADSKALIEKAKTEVKLKTKIDGNKIEVYVDGPFRGVNGKLNWDQKKLKYIVKYDIKLKVPFITNLSLSTINDGSVRVEEIKGDIKLANINGGIKASNITGEFKISAINGKVILDGMAGSGSARTINGKLKILFNKNPQSDCSFSSLNGNVNLTFQSGLSADVKVSTLNGTVYSDFEAKYLTSAKGKAKRNKGMFIYKSNKFNKIRIGKGGIDFKISTLNGNIYISKVK